MNNSFPNTEVREIPENVKDAMSRLIMNGDIDTVLQWYAQESGVGRHDYEPDINKRLFQDGERATVVNLSEYLGCELTIQ